jgi:hypothetical protein
VAVEVAVRRRVEAAGDDAGLGREDDGEGAGPAGEDDRLVAAGAGCDRVAARREGEGHADGTRGVEARDLVAAEAGVAAAAEPERAWGGRGGARAEREGGGGAEEEVAAGEGQS